jgi:hypothetical protein
MKRVLMLAVVLVGATIACGLPQDDGPRTLANEAIPFDLLAPASTAPPVTGTGRVTATLFFLGGDRLQPVSRQVENSSPEAVLTALLDGVTAEDGNVRSAIPPGTGLITTGREDSVLVIELSAEILDQQGPDLTNAFAQLVFTASEVEGVFGVRFQVDGQFVSVPTDTGASDQAVYPVDFNSIRPEG